MQFKLNQIVGAAAALCAGAAMSQEVVVKIGHVAPMSGAQAHYGKDNENGARMAVEDLNAKGVTIGGKKVKFELLAEDDAGDPKQGTAAAQKLADAKVNGVIGHLNSGTTIPASKIYSDAGIPQISPSASPRPSIIAPISVRRRRISIFAYASSSVSCGAPNRVEGASSTSIASSG